MRLTNVLKRCAAVVRAAARRVGESLGLTGRTVVRSVVRALGPATSAVTRVVVPVLSTLRTHLGQLARVAVPVAAVACSGSQAPPAPPPAPVLETAVAAAPVAPSIDAAVDAPPERPIGDFYMTFYYIAVEEELSPAEVRPARALADAASAPSASGALNGGAGDVIAMAPLSPPAPALGSADDAAANDNVADDSAAGDDDEITLAATAAPVTVPMMGRDCQPLAEVSPAFAAQVRMQGTGRLRDGRLINVAGSCQCGPSCFHILPPGIKWGRGSSGLPLAPFRMVAVDISLIKMGSLLYVPELDGLRMPGRPPAGGFIHDGCVVAADVGGAIKGRQLDLFVARRAYYEGLARRGSSHGWATSVEVWDGSARCTRKGSKVSRSAAASI